MLFPAAKPSKSPKKTEVEETTFIPKYPAPKILLVDTGKEMEIALKIEGYNVVSGSFGTPYKVQMGDGFNPVLVNGSLPENYSEHEVIIIDVAPNDIYHNPVGDKHRQKKKTSGLVVIEE